MQVERMLTVKYAALQGAYWFLAAVGLAFVTPLLEGKGYSGLEIGCLNAVKYLSVIVFQVWLAAFSYGSSLFIAKYLHWLCCNGSCYC